MQEYIEKIARETMIRQEEILREFLKKNGYEIPKYYYKSDVEKILKQLKKEDKQIDVISYIETDLENNKIIECYIPFFNSYSNPIGEEEKREIATKYLNAEINKRENKKENLKNFLKELTELSNKYEIYIGGCGCCGSPYLYGEINESYDNLSYNEKLKKYNEEDIT